MTKHLRASAAALLGVRRRSQDSVELEASGSRSRRARGGLKSASNVGNGWRIDIPDDSVLLGRLERELRDD